MKNKTQTFLKKYRTDPSLINEKEFLENFKLELVKKNSLKMAKTYIYKRNKPYQENKKCIVLDVGGTNLRGAVAYYKNKRIYFSNIKQIKMPFNNDKNKFYRALANFIKSISREHLDVGFCFSFLCKMNKDLDGEIIDFGKNIKMKNVLHTYVAKELRKALGYSAKIKIINDGVASNLGIQLELNKKGNYVSYILGTGTNISYYEHNDLINVESAGFNKFKLSTFEQEIINETNKTDIFEKTCGGMYFATILNKALNHANKDQIIHLKKKINLTLNEYENISSSLFKDQESKIIAKEIVDALIKRIAIMNALMLVAVINQNKAQTTYLALEGTTLKKLPNFKRYLTQKITQYIKPSKIKFIESNYLNLKGALAIVI